MTLWAISLDGELLTSVFGIATLLAAGLAGLAWGTVKTLRDSNQDLRNRVSDLEDSDRAKSTKMAELESENKALGRLVTGEVHWQSIADMLDHHHREAQRHWDEVLDLLRSYIRDRGDGA